MGIAAMHTRFRPIIAVTKFVQARGTIAYPEITLRRAARKNHMRELFDFSPKRFIRAVAYPGCTVCFGPGHRDQNVLLSPVALSIGLAKVLELDLELFRPLCEGSFAIQRGIRLL